MPINIKYPKRLTLRQFKDLVEAGLEKQSKDYPDNPHYKEYIQKVEDALDAGKVLEVVMEFYGGDEDWIFNLVAFMGDVRNTDEDEEDDFIDPAGGHGLHSHK